ncbi:MAG: carboxypeptidase regulatory-like domain-containing protein, partial [Segetibacter sp.]|nr:carboxypeptidase regulatory-like domain-containing protein [Segetibacter sp.]
MKPKLIALRIYSILLLGLLSNTLTFSQNNVPAVKGVVKNDIGEPMAGVSVTIQDKKSYNSTTQTDEGGVFTFTNVAGTGPYTFTMSYIGFEKKVLNGYQNKNGEPINLTVVMESLGNKLNDVVVVGYGTQKKVNLTGAVGQIDAK